MDDELTREEIEDEREDVAEDIEDEGGETEEEAAEQRTDDYEGIVRRLDDLASAIADGFGSLGSMISALGVINIESGGFNNIDASDVAEEGAEAVAEVLDIEDLDLL